MAQVPVAEGVFSWPADEPQLIGSRCSACGMVTFPAQDGQVGVRRGLRHQRAVGGDDELCVREALGQEVHHLPLPDWVVHTSLAVVSPSGTPEAA